VPCKRYEKRAIYYLTRAELTKRQQARKYYEQKIPQFLRCGWPYPVYKAFHVLGAMLSAIIVILAFWCGVLLVGRESSPWGGLLIIVGWIAMWVWLKAV
jgi:hypothetical protein